MKISVIIPLYNEEGNIEKVIEELKNLEPFGLEKDFEIIFIDDGSSDDSLVKIKKYQTIDPRIKYISFCKNFGHQLALKAGFDHAKGNCAISLDCDLQHPPSLIPQMLEKYAAGYEIVSTKTNYKDFSVKIFLSKFFYNLFNLFSEIKIIPFASDFRLLDRKVIEIIKQSPSQSSFLRGFLPTLNFKQIYLEYIPNERYAGASKYSFIKMLNLALKGFELFSKKSFCNLLTFFGLVLVSFGFLGIIYFLLKLQLPILFSFKYFIPQIMVLCGLQLTTLSIIIRHQEPVQTNYLIKEMSI